MLDFAVSDLPPIAVVVPTYWTQPGDEQRKSEAVYDHPTRLDENGTLGRLLESLCTLDTYTFYVVVIIAVTDSDAEAPAHVKVQSIVSRYRDLTTILVTAEDCNRMKKVASMPLIGDLIGLTGYARVRNLQLAVPLLLGAEYIVALDDDEVVTDLAFLEKATQPIGSVVEGQAIEGLGGYYLQNDRGNILLDVPPNTGDVPNMFDRKAAIMNRATERLEALPGRIVPTPFCFGGNMVFSRDLASNVAFDPSITRGEDIDYLINARLSARAYFMNKDLRILHLPPSGGSYKDVAHHKVVQDVLRFIYEREKVRHSAELGTGETLSISEYDPYPGCFLRDDLDRDAREVITRIFDGTSPQQRRGLSLGDSVESFMASAEEKAERGVSMYCSYQNAWRGLTSELATNVELRASFRDRVDG